MTQQARTFRVFVSSTFSDLKAERNALQEQVFLRLRELCQQHGARFQAIDLRWGVSEEAALDQQTMNICLGEIERCQKVTPRPNFIVLLGDRYGWRPLPPQIHQNEFEAILDQVRDPQERALLLIWYRLDDNAVPAEYCLQPRTGEMANYDHWTSVERQLQHTLETAAHKIQLEPDKMLKYTASATEQEIENGALRIADAREHVYCFFRKIEGLPHDTAAKSFIDLDADGCQDEDSAQKLADLKSNLESLLQKNVHHYSAEWLGDGITTAHIGVLPGELVSCMPMLADGYIPNNLCEAVWRFLARVIQKELSLLEDIDPLQAEIDAHAAFAHERARVFVGRLDPLEKIAAYLAGSDKHPLVIWGEAGSGKSALMAKAVQQAIENHPTAQVIYRFIGVTPDSPNTRVLLENLFQQITRAYGVDEESLPRDDNILIQDFFGLIQDYFSKLYKPGQPRKPLLIFIDALDQLWQAENVRILDWIPENLPGAVRLVVSTLPGKCKQTLEGRLSGQNLVELPPMSPDQGSELLDIWLKEAGRRLKPSQRWEVLEKFGACGLPLYLKLAFEEARLWRSFALDTALSSDIPGVVRVLFARLSAESNHGEVLVSHALGYLAAARNGLSEDEVLDVLSLDEQVMADFLRRSPESPEVRRLPVVVWSRLYFDLKPYLSEQRVYGTTLLGFFHRQMAEIAKVDFLSDDVKLIRHHALAVYFASHTLSMEVGEVKSTNQRMVFELPYQQTMAEMWLELEVTLTDIKFIEAKSSAGLTYDLVRDYNRIGVSRLAPGTAFMVKDQRRPRLPWRLFMPTNKAAGELIEAPLSSKLSDFADFVGNQAHILNIHPELTFQQAQLSPQDSATALAAEEIWQSGGYHQPWLRWINKPRHRAPRLGTYVGHNGNIEACTFSPNGKRIASMASELIIWDTESTAPLVIIQVQKGWNKDCEFSPDGQMIVAPTGESLSIWDVETGALLVRFEGHSDNVTACAYSPDGERIVSASWDKTLKVWDTKRGVELFTMRGHKEILFDCDYSPNGKQIVSASYDNTLKIWNASNGSQITTLTGHTNAVSACKYSPDGQFIISASFDDTIKLWDACRGKELKSLTSHDWPLNDCSYSPDGRYVVSVDSHGYIKFWDPRRGSELSSYLGHAGDITSCAFSPDGEMLISGSSRGTELKLWDVAGLLTQLDSASHQDSVISCVFSPNGQKVASNSHDKTSKLWDVNSGAQIATLNGHKSGVVASVFTPDNQRLVTASLDSTLKLWDANNGKLLSTLSGHAKAVRVLAISPDGRRMLSGSDDNTLILWDLLTATKLHQLDAHLETVPGLLLEAKHRISPESRISSNGDFIILHEGVWLRIQDFRQDNQIASLVTEGAITNYAWSSAGGTLVAGDSLGNVYILKLEGIDLGAALVTAWYSSRDESVAFGCPWCYLWSPISKSMVGTVVSCPKCGSLIKLNATMIHADWTNNSLVLSGSLQHDIQDKDEFGLHEFWKDPNGLQTSLGNQAMVLKDRGEPDVALNLFREQERICRKNNFNDWLQWSLGNQALILFERGDWDGAMALYQEQDRLARKLGSKDDLQRALGNQALILYERGDLNSALLLYQEQGEICRAQDDKFALQFSVGRQGLILYRLGDFNLALPLFIEREHLCRAIGEKSGLQSSLCNQGIIYHERGNLVDAIKYYQEAEDICRGIGDNHGLSISLGNQGEAKQAFGDLDGAMALFKEQEYLCREQNNLSHLKWSLGNQASILEARGEWSGAERLRDEVKDLSRQENGN